MQLIVPRASSNQTLRQIPLLAQASNGLWSVQGLIQYRDFRSMLSVKTPKMSLFP